MVLASAVLAFVMLTSMFALPAMGRPDASQEAAVGQESTATMSSAVPTVTTATEALVTDNTTVTDPQVFTMLNVGEPDYIDPAVSYTSVGTEVIQNVYQTLVWYDRESAEYLVPVLATEVPTIYNGGVSPDGLTYTFTIRDGVTFHDGTNLTAEDVAYSIQRALRIHDPDGPIWMLEQVMTDYLSYYLYGDLGTYVSDMDPPEWILDAIGTTDPAYILTEDDLTAVAMAAVSATDEMTVTFHLTTPYAGFLKICASTVMSIVSKDFVEANGGVVNGEHNYYIDSHACGTGPYRVVSWELGYYLHMARYPGYWGVAPAIEEVYLIPVYDPETRVNMLFDGTADSAAVSLSDEYLFAGSSDYEVYKGSPNFEMTFAGFNMDIDTATAAEFGGNIPSDFFTDRHVRNAFVHLIDYQTYIENVLAGNAVLPNGAIPMGMLGYDPAVPTYTYDLVMAEDELKLAINPETGNSWWEDGFCISLFYNAGNIYRETLSIYMADALENLGTGQFSATVNTLDWPTYLSLLRMSPSPFAMFYFGWAPDYADPDDYATPILDSAYGYSTFTTGYVNESIDSLVRQAAVELDEGVRSSMYGQMSTLVYEDVPYMWLWQDCNFHVQRSWVDGYYFNPMYGGLYYPSLSKGDYEVEIEAVISVTPPVGSVSSPVIFDGTSSYSVDGMIDYYQWDFGDGSTAYDPIVEHVYYGAGDYLVMLTVWDNLGHSDTDVLYYSVLFDNEPDAYEDDDSYTDASVIVMGETQVHSISDDGADVDWVKFTLYDWTDITVYTSGPPDVYADTVLYLYDEYGVPFSPIAYNDDNGYSLWSTISMSLGPGTYYIEVQSLGMWSAIPTYYLTLDLWVPQPPYVEIYFNTNYTFVGVEFWIGAYAYDPDGYIAYFNWDFGDGTYLEYTWSDVYHTYYAVGEYEVTVTAVDNTGMEASDTAVVIVVTAPVAVISVTPEVGSVGSPSTFDGTGSYSPDGLDIIYYYWDFGDGWGGDGAVVEHAYSQAGTYAVYLYIYDESYAWNYEMVWYEVVDAMPPVAIAAYDIAMPLVGETVTFDGSWSFDPDGTIVRYIWQFGDGTVAEGMYAEHAYENSGVYEVRLTVVDDSMLTDENTVWITVVSVPVAAFEMTPEKPAAGALVTFYAYGSYDGAGIVDYSWSFGDGTYANGWEVTHVYTATGRYTVTLTVTNIYGVQSSVSESVTVRGHAPSISGTVVDSALVPVNSATVSLYSGGLLVAQVRTDGSGEFGFGSLAPGAYMVIVSKGGIGAASFMVAFTGVPVDVGDVVLGSGGVLLTMAVKA